MKAGQELDKAIHSEIFNNPKGPRPRYSTNLMAAWQVVEYMRSQRYYFHIDDYNEDTNAIQGGGPRAWNVLVEGDWNSARVRDRSLAFAICAAVLTLVRELAILTSRQADPLPFTHRNILRAMATPPPLDSLDSALGDGWAGISWIMREVGHGVSQDLEELLTQGLVERHKTQHWYRLTTAGKMAISIDITA